MRFAAELYPSADGVHSAPRTFNWTRILGEGKKCIRKGAKIGRGAFPRGLNTSWVWWCTGVSMDRHPATSLITSSQPLTLLLAAAVYDLPTGTVSLCLAIDSARTAVGLSTMPARQSETRCRMNVEILTVLIVLNGSWKQFFLAATSVSSAL